MPPVLAPAALLDEAPPPVLDPSEHPAPNKAPVNRTSPANLRARS
jgi:hypothetical protein